MARKKTAADEIYNIRRRARREEARLRKQSQNQSISAMERRAALKAANDLREQIRKSYVSTAPQAQREETLQQLGKQFRHRRTQRTARQAQIESRNNAFKREMALALKGKPSAISADGEKGRILATTFMHAQQDIRRINPRKAYENIMRNEGTDLLSEAFQKTIKRNQDSLRDMFRTLRAYDDEGRMKDTSVMSADEGDAKYKTWKTYLSDVVRAVQRPLNFA